MQVCIEHQHWASAQLMSCAIHAFAHARLAGMSSELVPGECTQLCLGQPELPGVCTVDHAVWEFNEGQESPCSPPSVGCHDEVMVPAA